MTNIHYLNTASTVRCGAKMGYWQTNPAGWRTRGNATGDIAKVTCPSCRGLKVN